MIRSEPSSFCRILLVVLTIAATAVACTRTAHRVPVRAIPPDRTERRPDGPPPGESVADESWLNLRVNQDSTGEDQYETVITANPEDPLNLIAGAIDWRTGGENDVSYYTTFDGGETWTDGILEETTFPRQCDPAVAFCTGGRAVYVALSYDMTGFLLYSYRSLDGGASWAGPYEVAAGKTDKPWLACDTTSGTYQDRAYACWTEAGVPFSEIWFSWSRDSGKRWSSPIRISPDLQDGYMCNIAVTPDGTVHVAYKDGGYMRAARSTDGGRTFSAPLNAARYFETDPEMFPRPTMPILAADRSGGPHSGNLYMVWADRRFNQDDILFIRSTDGGLTWSDVFWVNDEPRELLASQWLPWIDVDSHGRVIVAFLDRRRNPDLVNYEVWAAISRDGGQSFDVNFPVSDVPSNPGSRSFIGDYIGLAAAGDRFYPLWPDLRNGVLDCDIYTDAYPNRYDYDEVRTIHYPDKDDIDFEPQDPRFGHDVDYDLASGHLSELRADGGFDRASCAASRWADPPIVDGRVPPAGDGYWHLVRAHGPNGIGSYGRDGTWQRPNVRDPLNEALDPCP